MAEKKAAKERRVVLNQEFFIRGHEAKIINLEESLANEPLSPSIPESPATAKKTRYLSYNDRQAKEIAERWEKI